VSAIAGADILPFRDEHAPAFDRLNRDWLTRYFSVEPLDEEYLRDPWRKILAPGGAIFVAVLEGEVVGTCAAMPVLEGSFELAKLGVAPSAQRHGVGRRLVERVIGFARERRAPRILLWSSSSLGPAVRLYESLGFVHTAITAPAPYDDPTVDVFMTLELGHPPSRA
jgi:GNAT superfamily N-acetyltransferase